MDKYSKLARKLPGLPSIKESFQRLKELTDDDEGDN